MMKNLIRSAAGVAVIVSAFSLGPFSGCSSEGRMGAASVDELKLPGDLCDFIPVDLDNDSIEEIIAFSCSSNPDPPARWASIFAQENDHFKKAPQMNIELPDDAVVFDSGDIDGDGQPELLFLTGHGLSAIKIGEDGRSDPIRIIEIQTIFQIPTPRSADYCDFFRHLSQGNRDLLIIPTVTGVSIYTSGKDNKIEIGKIPLHFSASISGTAMAESRSHDQVAYNFRLPLFEFIDYDGDGVEDLYVIDNGDVDIYLRSFDGTFAPEPVSRTNGIFRVDNPGAEEATEIMARDINADGLGDLIVTRRSGGVKNLESDIDVFPCRARGGHDQIPSFHHSIRNSAGIALLSDLNHDGRLDIVIPSMKTGILAILKILILNRIDLGLEIFLQEPGGRFPDQPSMSNIITASADLNSGAIHFGNNIATSCDFNGDRLCDLLIETGDGTLNVYYGAIGEVISEKPGWTYRIPAPSSVLASDLDNDGISEILAFYNDADADRDIIRVIHVGE